MTFQLIAEIDSTISPRSKATYDRSPMKPTNAHRNPGNNNRRNSAGNTCHIDHRQQNRRRSERLQQENRPGFHQRRSSGQQRQIQRRSDSYTNRRSPKAAHATKTITKKPSTVTRSPPKNRRPNKKAEAKPTAEDLDRDLEAYMKRPISA
uniref:FoP_duplication domain-containing protein n=1 Tax=Panagrellus redivivus TaxID=6233 RepID=A0A7E4VE19_PANRE